MKNTVYFNPEWLEALELLREDVRHAVIAGIISYQITGIAPEINGAKASFMLLKLEVDRNMRRLKREREKRRQKKMQPKKQVPAPQPSVAEKKNQSSPSPNTPQAPLLSPCPPGSTINSEKPKLLVPLAVVPSLPQPQSPPTKICHPEFGKNNYLSA